MGALKKKGDQVFSISLGWLNKKAAVLQQHMQKVQVAHDSQRLFFTVRQHKCFPMWVKCLNLYRSMPNTLLYKQSFWSIRVAYNPDDNMGLMRAVPGDASLKETKARSKQKKRLFLRVYFPPFSCLLTHCFHLKYTNYYYVCHLYLCNN